MKLYRKDGMISQYKIEPDWEEFEDELVMTEIGERLLSYTKTKEFEDEVATYRLFELRQQRETECFSVINQNFIIDGKSVSWFDTLTDEQKQEANIWVQSWRDVTETKVVPEKPDFIK